MSFRSTLITDELPEENNIQDSMQAPRKFSFCEMLSAYFTINQDTLRKNGFTPLSLYKSSELSFKDKQTWRAQMQCDLMRNSFNFSKSEASIFEKSGDLLSSNGLPEKAYQHWKIAFEYGHRPLEMTVHIGQYALQQGDLETAYRAFYYLSQMPNVPYYVHNELGVVQLMKATKQRDLEAFVEQRFNAVQSFERASPLESDPIAEQNKLVASVLSHNLIYSSPWQELKCKKNSSTRIIDALMNDLSKNEVKSETNLNPGWTSDGKLTFAVTSSSVPYYPNQFALCTLTKIKEKQLLEDKTGMRITFSK